MAIVVLTDAQKEIMKSDAGYQLEVKWGILNKSVYWQGQTGVSPPGGTVRWAKSRSLGTQIVINPGMAEGANNVNQFLILGKNIPCVDDSQAFSASAVVAYLLSTNGFDTISDSWFDTQISATPF